MVDNGVETYGYGAGNRRLWKKSTVSGSWAKVYLYGLRGEVLEVFRGTMGSPLERQSYTPTQRAWFGGRLIEKLGTAMNADRLGSYQGTYPYGELQGAVGTPGEKFGTYWRDATGLDYAVNRYYSPQMGRFLSADPYVASGGAADPGSWNRYAYVEGDPVNLYDPGGLQAQAPYPPGYCPAQYSFAECMANGLFSGGPDGGAGGGGGGASCTVTPNFMPNPLCSLGSERESDGRPILGGFPESDEFGLRRRHALNLEEQVASVLVAPSPRQHRSDIAVDRLHHAQSHLHPVVAQ